DLNRALTVPLLCSAGGGGLQAEGLHQVKGGRAQLQVVQRRPQVDDVPLLAAARVEAAEHVVVQVDAEGAAAAVAAMDRAGAAALRAAATQARRQPQVLQHPAHRQLGLEVAEVEEGCLADRCVGRYRGGTGCGDH